MDLLIDAFEKVKMSDLSLIIAGSGSIPEELRGKISDNKRITLINRYIKDEEFEQLLNKVDFVVLPYKRASQSGVIPMSFAFGKAVIATRVGALEEQLPDGTGIIVAPTHECIAEAIDWFYQNQDKIITYGDNSKKIR